MLKFVSGLLVVLLILIAGALALGLVQLRGGSLPAVAIKEGSLPKADVAKIEVGTRNETVEVPTVDVRKP